METTKSHHAPSHKLACPSCGAVVYMTDIAMRLSGGIACSRDQLALVPVPRRAYSPRRTAVAAS